VNHAERAPRDKKTQWRKAQLKATQTTDDHMNTVLFIEVGTGCDQHGQREDFGATVRTPCEP
jgi:hypothetical protein